MRFWLRVFLLDLRDLMRETFRYWHPDAVTVRVTRWARDQHRPIEVGDDAGSVYCTQCRKVVLWPCDEWVRLHNQLARLERI